MNPKEVSDPIDAELRVSFLAVLIEDVIAARSRRSASDTPGHRREVFRATFAAIEGSTWLYREHVRFIAKKMDVLTPFADLALRERTFNVSDRGIIIEQVRFITLPTMIRLTTRQARLIVPSLWIEFDGPGWSGLKRSLDVRHRVTHPKNHDDLLVSDDDMLALTSAFSWVLSTTEAAMAAAVDSFKTYVAELRHVVDGLASGDETILAAYHEAQMRDDED